MSVIPVTNTGNGILRSYAGGVASKPHPAREQQTQQRTTARSAVAKLQSERDIALFGKKIALECLEKEKLLRKAAISEREQIISERDAWRKTAETYQRLVEGNSEDTITRELIASISTVERVQGVTRRIKDEIESGNPDTTDGLVLGLGYLIRALGAQGLEEQSYRSTGTITFLVSLVNRWRRTALALQDRVCGCEQTERKNKSAAAVITETIATLPPDTTRDVRQQLVRALQVLKEHENTDTSEHQIPLNLSMDLPQSENGVQSTPVSARLKSRREQLLEYVPKKAMKK